MKVKITALLPNELVHHVQGLSGGKTVTEALVIALSEWASSKRIQALNKKIQTHPLRFRSKYDPLKTRMINRKK